MSNPYDYLSATAVAFSMNNTELYDFIGTLEVLTEQVTLGGLSAIYALGDTIFGYKSKLIENFNALYPTTTTYTDESWK